MKINMFLTQVLPNFSKASMKKSLDETKKELREETLPQFKSASQSGFDKRQWKAEVNMSFQTTFDNGVRGHQRGNMLAATHRILQNLEKTFPTIEKLTDDYFSNDVVREAITFLGVNLIQFQEAMAFATRYSRKLLLFIITEEVRAVAPDQVDPKAILQGEINWLYAKRETFFAAMSILTMEPVEIGKALENTPDIVANAANVDQVTAMVGLDRVDPFRFNLISARMNPIFYIRKWIVEGQVASYREAQEERKQLECRILQLKNADDGKNDPKLQQIIEYNEKRLHRYTAQIAEMEADNE